MCSSTITVWAKIEFPLTKVEYKGGVKDMKFEKII